MMANKWNDQINWLARRMFSIVLAFVTGTALLLTGCDKDKGSDNPALTIPVTVTATIDNLAPVLAGLADNTADNPHTISLAAGTNLSDNWTAINTAVQSAGKYVILDLSACTATGNTVTGYYPPSGSDFNIIMDNEYIKGVSLPDTLTSIGDYAFFRCTNLTSVTIPGGVTSIGVQAFYLCTGLTSVTIPASVTSIEGYAFSGGTQRDELHYPVQRNPHRVSRFFQLRGPHERNHPRECDQHREQRF